MCHTRAQSLPSRLHRFSVSVTCRQGPVSAGPAVSLSRLSLHDGLSLGQTSLSLFSLSNCRRSVPARARLITSASIARRIALSARLARFSLASQCIYVYNVSRSPHPKSTFAGTTEPLASARSESCVSPLLFPPTVFVMSRLAPVRLTDRRVVADRCVLVADATTSCTFTSRVARGRASRRSD